MRMSQSLTDCRQNLDQLWDEFGWIDFYSPWNQGYYELIDSLGFRFMVGRKFGDNPLQEPAFLLVFLFDFPWYKKNTQN